ncbi:MAG: hypothetical protein IJP58_00660, partial [Clostridia bacterium]|nr:hypothetical protein [Clostridia bacterium]
RGFGISENIPWYDYDEGSFTLGISPDDSLSYDYTGYNPYTKKEVSGSLTSARHFNLNVQSSGALFRVDAYDTGATVADPAAVVHQGYSNGFACAVSNTATIQNAYYFNESSYNKAFTNNNSRGTSTYSLGSTRTYNYNSASLTRTDYWNQSNFSGWDFDEVWTISPTLGRPVLYSIPGSESIKLIKVQPPEGDDSLFRVWADNPETVTFNLANYVRLSDGTSTAGRFTYTINSGGDVASVEGDAFTVRANLARGDYPVSLTGHDPTGKFKDFPVEITVRSVTRIYQPVAEKSGFPYSRSIHLSDIGLTAPVWWWADDTIIPINDYDGGYDAMYPFDTYSYLYDWSLVPDAVYDAETNTLTAKVPVLVYASDESPWSTYINVLDADTHQPIEGAYVSHTEDFEFPEGHLTNNEGRVYAQITAGTHTIKSQKARYYDTEEEVTVRAVNGNEFTLYMTPERTEFRLPKVCTSDGTPIEGARVTGLRTSAAETAAWNNGDKAFEADAYTTREFPAGSFTFSNATPGYTALNEVYAEVSADGTVKYYDGHKNEISEDDFIIYVD